MAANSVAVGQELDRLLDLLARNPGVMSGYATEPRPVTYVRVFLDSPDVEHQYRVYDAEVLNASPERRLDLLVLPRSAVEHRDLATLLPSGSRPAYERHLPDADAVQG